MQGLLIVQQAHAACLHPGVRGVDFQSAGRRLRAHHLHRGMHGSMLLQGSSDITLSPRCTAYCCNRVQRRRGLARAGAAMSATAFTPPHPGCVFGHGWRLSRRRHPRPEPHHGVPHPHVPAPYQQERNHIASGKNNCQAGNRHASKPACSQPSTAHIAHRRPKRCLRWATTAASPPSGHRLCKGRDHQAACHVASRGQNSHPERVTR